jgi:hypothetical protein
MNVSIHRVVDARLTRHNVGETCWVNLIVTDDEDNRHEITLFHEEDVTILGGQCTVELSSFELRAALAEEQGGGE